MRIQDPENKIPEDEPVFLLRGQDKFAPELLLRWAAKLRLSMGNPEMARMVEDHAQKMLDWQTCRAHKLPDLDPAWEEGYIHQGNDQGSEEEQPAPQGKGDPYNLLGVEVVFLPNLIKYKDEKLKVHTGIPEGVLFKVVEYFNHGKYWLQQNSGVKVGRRIRLDKDFINFGLVKVQKSAKKSNDPDHDLGSVMAKFWKKVDDSVKAVEKEIMDELEKRYGKDGPGEEPESGRSGAEIGHCPICGDELMQQVNSTNLNCVRCGETVKAQAKPDEEVKKPCRYCGSEVEDPDGNVCVDCWQKLRNT